MVFSLASCSQQDTEPGTDISIVSQKIDSRKDPDSSKDNRLTPAVAETEHFTKTDYSDYKYFARAKQDDIQNKVLNYYEGEITSTNSKSSIFMQLIAIIKHGELTVQCKQTVLKDTEAILTMKQNDGSEYALIEGLLKQNPDAKTGKAIYIFKTPHSEYYLNASSAEQKAMRTLIQEGVATDENIVKSEPIEVETEPRKPEPKEPVKRNYVQIKNPIAFMQVRSNAAWGFQLNGMCIDTQGHIYQFSYQESDIADKQGKFEEKVLAALQTVGAQDTQAVADVGKLRQALAIAAKIDPNAKVTSKHEACDYGQNTLYAIVDGKPLMLRSYGDNSKTVEDDNATKAIAAYEDALSSSVAPAEEKQERVITAD